MSSLLKTGFGKAIAVGLVIIVVLVGFLIFNSSEPADDGESKPDLNIITRHDIVITNSFKQAFLASSYASEIGYGPGDEDSINFKSVSSLTGWLNQLGRDDLAIDLAWGGGPTLFNQMIDAGLLAPITDQELLTVIDASVPESVAGVDMREVRNGDIYWVANAISSFGFTVNHDVLDDFSLPMPETWEDLASPDFYRSAAETISMGNPLDTTSNTRIYQIILQKFGWDKGWEILSRMGANAGIYGGSVETRSAVISGEVAVAMTIDFYGLIAQQECDSCEYVIPINGSIVNGDPIAFGKLGKNPDAANAFFKYVNSAEGQAEWMKSDRLPINVNAFNTTYGETRQDISSLYSLTLSNQGIDFDEDLSSATEFTMQQYFKSVITDSHTELRSAWGKLVDSSLTGDAFGNASEDLFAPLITIQNAIDNNDQLVNDASYRISQTDSWTSAIKTRYNSFNPLLLHESSSSMSFIIILIAKEEFPEFN